LLENGASFGPYKIVRLLGRGGMGEVYEADHVKTGRRVAVKILAETTVMPSDRARFLREGRLAAQLSHPHSVYLYGTEEIEGRPVISMELVQGGTLKDRLKRDGPLPARDAVGAILQVIQGLEAAAALGVLHRDVKPANCFVERDGTVKVGDFGLSISTLARGDTQLTATGTILGTPAYASPEQLRGKDLDVRADIYSVGATLYHLLTGRPPFTAANAVNLIATIMNESPASPRGLRPGIPRKLARVILRCLEKNPARRPADYADLARSLFPFGPAPAVPAKLPKRITAGVFDTLLFELPVLAWVMAPMLMDRADAPTRISLLFTLSSTIAWILYFTISEGIWGASLGKAALGLRVMGRDGARPGIGRALLRVLVFEIPAVTFMATHVLPELLSGSTTTEQLPIESIVGAAYLALLFSTARRRNGFAALHDMATGTKVVQRPVFVAQRDAPARIPARPREGTGERLGPYLVPPRPVGTAPGQISIGHDPVLRRSVWVRHLADGAAAVSAGRRDLRRAGRPRWLTGRRDPDSSWDAYEALEGQSLVSMLGERLPWERVRYWLLDLAEELDAGLGDGTLPKEVGPDRIWITLGGRAKLLDFPAPETERLSGPAKLCLPAPSDAKSAQGLLASLALASLEGVAGTRMANGGRSPAVPLPLHARDFLTRLSGQEFGSLTEVITALQPLLQERAGFPWKERLRYAVGFALVPAISFIAMSLFHFNFPSEFDVVEVQGPLRTVVFAATFSLMMVSLLSIPALISSVLLRGGLVLLRFGLAVVLEDGSPAPRIRTFWRSLVAYTPALLPLPILLTLPIFGLLGWLSGQAVGGETGELVLLAMPWLLWLSPLAILAFIVGAVWFVVSPDRGPQDRLARTYLVPR
jgi:uncharacterized RDD family membrane protein YckC